MSQRTRSETPTDAEEGETVIRLMKLVMGFFLAIALVIRTFPPNGEQFKMLPHEAVLRSPHSKI
jgi:hypothetical protein